MRTDETLLSCRRDHAPIVQQLQPAQRKSLDQFCIRSDAAARTPPLYLMFREWEMSLILVSREQCTPISIFPVLCGPTDSRGYTPFPFDKVPIRP